MATISANGSKGHHKFTLTVNEISTSAEDNTSTVEFSFTISPIVKGYNWYGYSADSVRWEVQIGGAEIINGSSGLKVYEGSITSYDGQSTVNLASGRQTIPHSADGTGTVLMSLWVHDSTSVSYLPGNASADTQFELSRIARPARLDHVGYEPSKGIDGYFYADYTKYSNNYTYKLRISIPDVIALETISNYVSGTKVYLSQSTLNYLYNYASNSSTVRLGFVIETWSGSTKIGESVESIGNIPITNANPTLTSATAVDVNSATIALTGNSNTIVKGVSNLKVSDIVASAYKGAILKSIIIDDISATYTSGYTKTINGYTKNNVAIKVVDSRSKTSDTLTKTFGFVDYLPITKTGMTVSRSSSRISEGVTLALNGKWFNGSFGKVTNTLSVTYRFKETTASSWTTGATTLNVVKNGNDFSINQSIRGDLSTGFNIDKSYNLEVIFTDKLSTATFATIIGTGSPAMAIKGNKIALGGKFDDSLGLDVQFRKCPFPIGYIYMSTSSDNPNKYFGGTWERIKGRYLLGVDESASSSYYYNVAGKSFGSWYTDYHTLTVDEIPSHSHKLIKNVPYGIPYNDTTGVRAGSGTSVNYKESYNPFSIGSTGGSGSHNHGRFVPPSFSVYIWRRTA